jgi:hypothetical protein
MKYRHINIIGSIIIICIIILLYVSISRKVEAFDDASINAECGQSGFALPPFLTKHIPDLKGVETIRFYTDKECTALGGITNFSGKNLNDGILHCQLRDPENASKVIKDYSIMCGGLNAKYTPPPKECEKLGFPLADISGTTTANFPFKDFAEFNGVFRNYKKEDCDTLGGDFFDGKKVDLKNPNYSNISKVGLCLSKKIIMPYNIACANLNHPPAPVPVSVPVSIPPSPSFFQKLVNLFTGKS